MVYVPVFVCRHGVGPISQHAHSHHPAHPFLLFYNNTVVAALPTPTYPNFGFDVLEVRSCAAIDFFFVYWLVGD